MKFRTLRRLLRKLSHLYQIQITHSTSIIKFIEYIRNYYQNYWDQKYWLQLILLSLKRESSDKAKDVSNNSSNSKSTNAPQNTDDFEKILSLKNRISLLESEKRLLKDDIANKLRFIEIILNFNESNIQIRESKSTLSNLIQKNINTVSNNTVLGKKDKQRIKDVPPIEDRTPALEN